MFAARTVENSSGALSVAPGHEKISGAAHEAGHPQPGGGQEDRIANQQPEMDVHGQKVGGVLIQRSTASVSED